MARPAPGGRRRPTRPATRRPVDEAAREAKLAALHDQLAEQVAALRTGQDWQVWLRAAARFHTYSFNNTLLILAQRPDATHVAGYETWKQLGRQVIKGERGIAVLAPVVRRRDNDTTMQPGAENPAEPTTSTPDPATAAEPAQASTATPTSGRVSGYRITYVWDLTQTTGDPLPEAPTPTLLAGHAPDGLWDHLAAHVTTAGFTLDRGPCGGANGITDFATRTVRVRDDVDDAQAVKTLAHELGHVLLHRPDATDAAVPCRGVAEVEAESVAYLVATTHGLDTSSYTFPYVTSWGTGQPDRHPEDVVRDTGQRVLAAARSLLQATTAQPEAGPEPQPGLAAQVSLDRRHAAIHEAAAAYYRSQVPRSWVPAYLRERDLAVALEPPWDAGYAPAGWTGLVDHLRGHGFDPADVVTAGLAVMAHTGRPVDRFRDRLVLPLRDRAGDVIGFVGRTAPGADDDRTPRYLNSPETNHYRKGEHLYGLTEAAAALAAGARPVLVEGPLDAIAVTHGTAGRCAGIAACGTAVTEAHLDQLTRHVSGGGLVVALDTDDAGHKAAYRLLGLLSQRGWTATAAALPDGADPAELLRRQGAAALTAALTDGARPLADVVIAHQVAGWAGRLRWAEGRIGALRAVAPVVAALPNGQIARSAMHLAGLLDLPADTVNREISACLGPPRLDRVTRTPPGRAPGPPRGGYATTPHRTHR